MSRTIYLVQSITECERCAGSVDDVRVALAAFPQFNRWEVFAALKALRAAFNS